MIGLENMIARLNAENEAECAAIVETARQRAQRIIDETNAAGNAAIAAAEKEARRQAEGVRTRAEAMAALDERRSLLEARVSLISEVLDGAKARLHDLPDEAYFKMLRELIARSRRPGQGVLRLSRRDLDRLPQGFAAALGEGIRLDPAPAPILDGFILAYGDIELNCTLSALFAAADEDLKAKAAALLFGDAAKGTKE